MTDRAAKRFNGVAANFATSEVHRTSATIERLRNVLAVPDGATVCDVACGAGHLGMSFAADGAEVTLLDPAPAMLEQVRLGASERGLSVEVLLTAAEEIPLPSNTFDVVVSRLAPHHFGDIRRAVSEMARITAPGGRVAIIDLQGDPDPGADELLHRIEVLHDPTHVRSYPTEAWKALLEGAGLVLELFEPDHRESPDGVPIARWCEIAGSGREAEDEIRLVLQQADSELLEALWITHDGVDFRYPVRTLLAVFRKSEPS